MDSIFKQIVKQVNKIIRILTKVTEQYPKISEEVDLALYATIKIEKIVNKVMAAGQSLQSDVNQYKVTRNDGSEDAFFTTALQTIENFKNNTFKLQRKVNVLINEQETRHVRKPQTNQSVYPTHSFKVVKKKVQGKRQVSQESADSSVNLTALDASIVKLVKKINAMNEEESMSEQMNKISGLVIHPY